MNFFMDLIYEYGLFAMVTVIFLEYACFPVSSEIVLPFSGAFASLRCIPYMKVILLSVIAGLLGTSLCYLAGRIGGQKIIEGLKKRFPKTSKSLNSSCEKFDKYGVYIVCFGRLIPICRTYIAFIAGAAKLNFRQYLMYSLFGITVWNSILIGLGYYLRENWDLVKEIYSRYSNILVPAVIIVLLILLYRYFIKKNRNRINQ